MEFSRRGAVDPFIVMDVMEDARKAEAVGASVIHMEVGQPGTPAPRLAREAAAKAIASDALGYTVALGLPELRERIARLYRDWYGIDVPASRIIVTSCFVVEPRTMESSTSTTRLPSTTPGIALSFIRTPRSRIACAGWMKVLPTYRFLTRPSV